MAKKTRRTRVTKKQVIAIREGKKKTGSKKVVVPGPWTNTQTKLEVKATLRPTQGIMGEALGTYSKDTAWIERGWYPIIINITSKSIKRDVEEHGLGDYLAACEQSLNNTENKKKYGTVILLEATVDNSLHQDRSHRFVSCRAKTNKKSIKGFLAIRQRKYGIIE